MPRLADKHANAEIVAFADFSGGLNLAQPPESIANNELQEAVNFEYSAENGSLRVRSGTSLAYEFPEAIRDIIYTAAGNEVLVRCGDDIYKLYIASQSASVIGAVDGGKPASSELWGDGNVLMAFGGKLYIYDGASVNAIDSEGAPANAEILFVRYGRVWVYESGTDQFVISGVGDPWNWDDDTDDDSSAKSVQIGYMDGCNIKAIATTVGDVIIFKSPDGQPELGRIYRLQGDYPDWTVIPYSRGSAAWNAQSVANVGNDILFLTREGVASLATVTEYGDFKLQWAGAKVNPRLSRDLTENCSLRRLSGKGQTWVLNGSADVWAYFDEIGAGAWTLYRFPEPVSAVSVSGDETYLAMGSGLYHMSEMFEGDGGAKIDGFLKPRTIARRNQALLKRVMARFSSNATSEVHLKIENLDFVIKYDFDGHIAFLDDEVACLDNEPLVPSLQSAAVRRRCNIRRWEITPELVVVNGTFKMSYLELEIAEV